MQVDSSVLFVFFFKGNHEKEKRLWSHRQQSKKKPLDFCHVFMFFFIHLGLFFLSVSVRGFATPFKTMFCFHFKKSSIFANKMTADKKTINRGASNQTHLDFLRLILLQVTAPPWQRHEGWNYHHCYIINITIIDMRDGLLQFHRATRSGDRIPQNG